MTREGVSKLEGGDHLVFGGIEIEEDSLLKGDTDTAVGGHFLGIDLFMLQ